MPNRRKPTAIKKLEGNPGKRDLNPHEPNATPGLPPKPDDLRPAASAEWDHAGPMLVRLGVLCETDGQAFRSYVDLWADWLELGQKIAQNPEPLFIKVTIDGAGNEHREPRPNPLYGMRDKMAKTLLAYFARFGMTPADRSRIIAVQDKAKPRKDSWAA